MLRTKKKQLNLKPNRVLDKRSSRGMLFENEELRLRTIHINDEVEKGQSEVKKLRKENEYLKREIWSLRDECEKLEEVLKKIYNGSEIPDLSELPAYQPTTRKHSTASAFGMWSSRRLSAISTYSSYCDYEDDDDDKSQRDDDNDNSRRHSTCNDSDNDHSTSGQYQHQDQQEQQQQQYQQYYEGGEDGAPPEEIVSVHVHYSEDGQQQYMTEYDDEGPSQRQPKISIDSTNSLESGQMSISGDMDMEQHNTETDLEDHSCEDGVDVHTIRYYNQALPLQPLHHHTWQLHSPELEAVTEESENNTVNTNSNNTSITITPQDQNNEESNNASFDTLDNLDNPNSLDSRAVSVNGDKDKSNTISPFFNPTIEITPASSTSTNSTSNSSVTSGKKVMSENMSNGDNNNSMGSVNNGTVGGGEVEESNIISSLNATSGSSSASASASGTGTGKIVVTKSIEGTRAERDRDGNGLPIDLGCVTLIPKKYQVTSEIKINTTSTSTIPSDSADSASASASTSTSVGQINARTEHEIMMNGPSTSKNEEEGEAGEHNSPHHHHHHQNPSMLQTQSGMKRKEEDGNLTDGENNLTSSWDPLPFPPFFEKTNQNQHQNSIAGSSTVSNTNLNNTSSRLEEKRRNFGQLYKNSQKTLTVTLGKENEVSSDSESQTWTGNNLGRESNNSNSQNISAGGGVRKKSLPLHQSEPSLTSIVDCNNQISNLRIASENNSCRCIHGFGGSSSSARQSVSGELGFDGFDHTVEMCSLLLSPLNPDNDVLQTPDNENEQDPSECVPSVNSGFPLHGWNSVDRNVVIGYLDEEENEKDGRGFEDLSAQEVIDELEMQFDPTLERVAGVRMLTTNVKIPRVFISLRTAVGVKTFIEKGFSLRSCPLKLMDASKKFALILLCGIPPAVPDTSVISILNEFGQVVAPLERRTYKGVDISERIARMHLVRKMPGGGTTTLNIAGYPVLFKILQTNVSPGLSNPNTLSRPHSVNQQHTQQQPQLLHLSPMRTQEMTNNNNSLTPPCEAHPSPQRYQSPNLMVQRQNPNPNQTQTQVPTSPRTAPIQPPSPGFIGDFRRPSTSIPVTPSSPGGGLRPHSPSLQAPAIPNSSVNSKIPSPHRKLGKSISAAPGYLPGNPDDQQQQQQQQQSQLHSLGPTAMAINKRKMSVCSMDPGEIPGATSTPKTPTSPNTNPKAFLGNPKKPLARLSRNSLVPQSSSSSNPNELLTGGQDQQQQQQSGSGLGMIKPLLRSLSFEPRRVSTVSTHQQQQHNNNNNNNISNKGPNHGSQVSLAESQQYQPFHGHGSRGSILIHSNSGSGRSAPKYYQPHGQLTNNNSNSSNFRNMDKKSSESALPWFGCC